MMNGSSENIPVAIKDQAKAAGCLSRTITSRPEAERDFAYAFNLATKNGQQHKKMDAQLYGQYSLDAMRYTNLYPDWTARFTDRSRIRSADLIFDSFYNKVRGKSDLTIEALAELYDKLNINEFLLDGNKRASILALTHILIQFGYQPPNFTGVSQDRLLQLQKLYPNDRRKTAVEFLREGLSVVPLSL